MNRREQLVTEQTAFGSWEDLVASMQKGYVPTVRPESRIARELRHEIMTASYKVFPAPRTLRVKLTQRQIDILLALAFPNVRDDTPAHGKSYIDAEESEWREVLSIVSQWDFEEVHGIAMRCETEQQYNFAVRSFEKSQGSMLRRIRAAVGWR